MVAMENVFKHKTVFTMYASVILVTKELNVRQLITAHQLPASIVEVVRMWGTLLSARVLVNGQATVVSLVIIVITVLVRTMVLVEIHRRASFVLVNQDGWEYLVI